MKLKNVYLVTVTEYARDTFVLKHYAKVFKTFKSALEYAKKEVILAEHTKRIVEEDYAEFIVFFDNDADWNRQFITVEKVPLEE